MNGYRTQIIERRRGSVILLLISPANPAGTMGYCNSRVQDDNNFIIVREDRVRQHSPWNLLENRPWYDHMEQEEKWLLKNKRYGGYNR
jgi:hypothetical protein